MSRLPAVAALACASALLLPAAAPAASKPKLYVSLGDSYATGYQVTPTGKRNTRNGFAYQVLPLARERGHRLKLVNFGCGGATTTSLLEQTEPCAKAARGPGGRAWGGRTQLGAAERFLRRNRGRVALVTVSIGGNDVTRCAREADAVACVGQATESLARNVTEIAERLRRAGGRKVRIVGTTYPNVILGQWVGADANQELAGLSVIAFQALINPTLKKAYEAAGGQLVDVTAAAGGYTPLDQTTTLDPYGTVPVAVARVCELTYYCSDRDIHANTAGYRLIAELVAETLPRRRR